MLLDIVWNNETTQVDLVDGTVTVGGATDDHIVIEGLPPGLIELVMEGPQVIVTSRRSVQIGAAVFPAQVPRLLGEGEELALPNEVVLRRPVNEQRRLERRNKDTAFVAKELLGAEDFVAPEATRAACLVCVAGFDRGRTFALAFQTSVIGRADDADVRVRDRTVSRAHAQVVHQGKRFSLRALSATNGLFLNGLKVQGTRALAPGDIIELGQTMLRFEGPERAPEEQTNVAPLEAKAGAAPEAPQTPAAAPAPGGAQTDRLVAPAPPAALEPEAAVTLEVVREPRGLPFELLAMGLGLVLVAVGAAVTLLMW